MSSSENRRYTELELADLNLDPVTEAVNRPACEAISIFEWKQMSLEDRTNYDLVVSPHSDGGIKVYEAVPDFDIGGFRLEGVAHVITPESGRPTSKPGYEKLAEELQRIREKTGEPPTASDIREHSVYSPGTYQACFGSLADAREQANVGQPLPAGELSKQDAEEILQDVEKEDDIGSESHEHENNELRMAPDYVSTILDDLNISAKSDVAETAMKLAKRHGTTRDDLISGAPSSIAAASVYTATLLRDEHRSQEEVSEAAGVSEATIRNNFHSLLETYQESSE